MTSRIGALARHASLVVWVLATAAPASGQPGLLEINEPARAGECAVSVRIVRPLPIGHSVQIDLNKNGLPAKRGDGRETVAFRLGGPLQLGDELRVREVGPGVIGAWSAVVRVVAGDGSVECEVRAAWTDDREGLAVSAYIGRAFDNFAPAEVGGYQNVAGDDSPASRVTFGTTVETRLWNSADDNWQLWGFMRAMSGVRTTDVDCRAPEEERPPVCRNFETGGTLTQGLYVLEHASSTEAFFGGRLELATLQSGTRFPIRLYATGVLGVMMLDDNTNRAIGAHHIGGGLLSPSGFIGGSYLEVGWGKSDLFLPVDDLPDAPGNPPAVPRDPPRATGHWNRLKVDAYLRFEVARMFTERLQFWKRAPKFFIHLHSDFDPLGADADSIQTFVGAELAVDQFFRR